MPEQVVAAAGIKQATGKIVWAEGPDVTDKAVTPWNQNGQWLPAQGEQVVIYAGDGVNEWPQFVGVIDETAGSVGGQIESSIVDYIDYLNRAVSHETVLRLHPPKTEGGAYIGAGMGSAYAIDRAFRACGFYATPRMESGAVLSVPCQNSMWPEYGVIAEAGAMSTSGTNTHADNHRATWGWCVSDFVCTYTPQGTIAPGDPVQLTARISTEHNGNFTLNAWYGSTRVQLAVSGSRTAIARLDSTDVVTLVMESGFTIVTLLIKNGTWTLKTNGGATATGSATIPAGANLTSISTTADEAARVAGLQVSRPPAGQEFGSLGHSSSAYQETGLFAGLMDVLPSYVDRPAVELLTEISKANLAPFWFNEFGQLRMIGSDILRNQAPVQTVTTLDDIFELAWENTRLGMRSRVTVKYRFPVLNRSRYSNVLLWQGGGETMESQQEKAMFAETPDGEDWAEIDHFAVSNAGGLTAFNEGRGTWIGGFLEDSAGNWTAATGYYVASGIQTISTRARLFEIETLVLPAGKKFVLATPDDAVNYFPRFRGMAYPVLRGRAKVQWIDKTLASATTGPYGFPELEHDAGPWGVQTANTIIQQRIADYIAGQVTKPAPTITNMRVHPDPRRQLGDVITISSPKLMGITITALIVGIHNAHSDAFTQTISVRIIAATSLYTTYAEYNETLPDGSMTYAQWQALGPVPQTYAQFNDAT
ncbi:hypothetical protein V1638_04260 [Pseudarthrobacter sp. J64]|uniref:hypothetical protein n=1 Tax=Pseudarthrobacter sp. J64 TaxID=3116485 RepID=UPI002E8162A3|nr:hypothetical protein [Pseudarthrobacter sp. J64]MEE2568610.1 hypothetical protein [Pseudarthrobacter sp. J64]